ncbi:MAG: hypothetical protein WAM92_05325 [Mycobacterium sp.]
MPGSDSRVVEPTPGTATDTFAAVSGLPTAMAASSCLLGVRSDCSMAPMSANRFLASFSSVTMTLSDGGSSSRVT